MATSTCIKCGSHSFEAVEIRPNGSINMLMFVQCSECGGVVGVVDYYNIDNTLRNMEKRLKTPV